MNFRRNGLFSILKKYLSVYLVVTLKKTVVQLIWDRFPIIST